MPHFKITFSVLFLNKGWRKQVFFVLSVGSLIPLGFCLGFQRKKQIEAMFTYFVTCAISSDSPLVPHLLIY